MSYGPELRQQNASSIPENFAGKKDFNTLWESSQPVDKPKKSEPSDEKFEQLWEKSTPLSPEHFKNVSDEELAELNKQRKSELTKAQNDSLKTRKRIEAIKNSIKNKQEEIAHFNEKHPGYAIGEKNTNQQQAETQETQVAEIGEEVHTGPVHRYARPTMNILDPTGKTPEYHGTKIEVAKVAKGSKESNHNQHTVGLAKKVPEAVDERTA